MSSFLKKILPVALGLAVPGIGTAIGSALGAGATFAPIVGNAALGAATGAIGGGGLKSALLGGVTGGAGAALGGFAGTGLKSLGDASTSEGLLAAGTGGVKGFNQAALGGSAGLSSALKAGIGKVATPGNVADIYSEYDSRNTQDEIKKKLLAAQNQAQSLYAPYSSAGVSGIEALQRGFDPSQIESDPGYQFRLSQGNAALERSLAARGLSSSGAALKAAQEYGQGLASDSYDNAFAQYMQRNSALANAGQSAADNLANIYGNIGNIGANNALQKNAGMSKLLSKLFKDNEENQLYSY